jgi:NosR/NirI family nitrous oxide reductase transcriptional regulator
MKEEPRNTLSVYKSRGVIYRALPAGSAHPGRRAGRNELRPYSGSAERREVILLQALRIRRDAHGVRRTLSRRPRSEEVQPLVSRRENAAAGLRGKAFLFVSFAYFAVCSPAAWGQEQKKQPPPEFTSGYQPPAITTPGPREAVFSSIDVLMLLAVMSLAAWFLLKKRSRREVKLLAVFSVLYFGFYRFGCVCAVGSLQNVALAIGNNGYALPLAVGAFFLLPLLFALFFGRVFCAAACPLGAIQDVVLHRPRRLPLWLEHGLSLVPYLYLGAGVALAATGCTFLICRYDPFIPFFRMGGSAGMVTFGAGMLLLSTVVGRPYCRFLCPYGVLLRWLAPFARWKVRIAPTECVNCHLCADSCPFGAIRYPTPEEDGRRRFEGRERITALVLLLPVLALAGGGLVRLSSPTLSRMNYTVALAERVWQEERGAVKGTTETSQAFRNRGIPNARLYAEAAEIRRRFDTGAWLFGAWAGLVVGLKLIFLSIRRRQPDYEADPAACLSCGRCYASCPVEREAEDALIPVSSLALHPSTARNRIEDRT